MKHDSIMGTYYNLDILTTLLRVPSHLPTQMPTQNQLGSIISRTG